MTPVLKDIDLSAEQVKAGRALLAWSQRELASRARVSVSTIADFERGSRTPVANNARAIREALEGNGLKFLAGGVVDRASLPEPSRLRPGSLMRWVNATDLAQWGQRRDGGQDRMPELLRKLIFASVGPRARMTFPSGDSVQQPGWDGYCVADSETQYVPGGPSAWEIGAQRHAIRQKAEDDFVKRSVRPLNVTPAETTFVFATPQRFPGKEAWCAEKKSIGSWRDVRVIDADDLVHWLETCPAVAQWMAVLVGRRPEGLRGLAELWDEWRRATRIPLTADLMLTGRDEDAASIHRWLAEPASSLAIQGDSVDEASAFLWAALDPLPPNYRMAHESRCLIASDADTARELIGIGTPLIVVSHAADAGLVQRLVADGHHVYSAQAFGTMVPVGVRQLARPWRHDLRTALVAMGVADPEAHRLAKDSGRSLTVLRRLMPSAPIHLPSWAAHPTPELLAAMLAGGWNEASAADREIISALAGKPYDQFEAAVAPFTASPEAPLLRSGRIWKLTSLRDSWTVLAPKLTTAQMERLEAAFDRVLSRHDPGFDATGREAWFGRENDFGVEVSQELRRGLTEAIIALGVYPTSAGGVSDCARRADEAVRRLLDGADAALWWSLSNDLRRLAEASPRAFLEAVDGALESDSAPIMSLFRSDEGFTMPTEYLSGLLWSLEMLARSPDYLAGAALLLAKLDDVDPGGRWGNRPGASLRRIFVSWLPQTYAGLEQRLKVIDAITRAFPQVGWRLLVALAPRIHDTSDFSPHPDWRDFAPEEPEVVTDSTAREAGSAIGHRLLANVGCDPDRWSAIFQHWPAFGAEWRGEAIARLGAVAERLTDAAERERMRDELRKFMGRHHASEASPWALRDDELSPLNDIFEGLRPEGLEEEVAWLFRHNGGFLRPAASWQEAEAEENRIQTDAATRLLSALDADALLAFARGITKRYQLGRAMAFAKIDETAKDAVLRTGLQSSNEADVELAVNLMHCLAEGRPSWLQLLWSTARAEAWVGDALVRIACALPATRDTWATVAETSRGLENAYWRSLPLHKLDASGMTEAAAHKLIAAGRGRDLVSWLGTNVHCDDLPAVLFIDALDAAVNAPAGDGNEATMFSYHLGRILDRLEGDPSVDGDRLVRLEWVYFQALRYSQRPPRTLHRALARNPGFFVDLIKITFLPAADSGVVEEPPLDLDRARALAGQAYGVLSDWRCVPGSDDTGAIDGAALEDWVKQARRLLASVGRGDVGDQKIGEILAASLRRPDEPWPPPAVRDVIELTRSRHLETGLEVGVFNQHGVTVRSPHDGGAQERDLAQRYRRDSSALRFDWPRTAATLDRIADDYDLSAQRADQRAEQQDWS